MRTEFEKLFSLSMKRELPSLLSIPEGEEFSYTRVQLGARSDQVSPGEIGLTLPGWNADVEDIPFEDDSIDVLSAYHFLEHVADPINMLAEIQRVLRPGGWANIMVPYYSSQLAYQDLEHRSWWTEETWRNLFDNDKYRREFDDYWRFEVGFNLIAGIKERNLALFTQLIKR